MKKLFKGLWFVYLMSFGVSSHAAYTANITSTILWIKIYNNDVIYFEVANQPTTQCVTKNFVIDPTKTSASQINRYYSMLLTAKSSKTQIAIGYDGTGVDCFNDRSVIYAIELLN